MIKSDIVINTFARRYCDPSGLFAGWFVRSLVRMFVSVFGPNTEIMKYCQEQFDFHLPSVLIARRTTKFLSQIAGFIS